VNTDYQDGDFPVPVGATVDYENGPYVVEGWHKDFENHPLVLDGKLSTEEVELDYPDGVTYMLFPADIPKELRNKMGMRHYRVDWVRRTSFRVIGEGENA